MTARELKELLMRRYPGAPFGGMPGTWTCIEEYRGIDLLAWSAWSSASKYARIGHEVKVSRTDLRKELLSPGKRMLNVAWCHQFYFAVPAGLLTAEEVAYEEPEWEPEDWIGERCPGLNGVRCSTMWWKKKTHKVKVPVPVVTSYPFGHYDSGWEYIICPTCKGKGVTTASRVEREAPTCWAPRGHADRESRRGDRESVMAQKRDLHPVAVYLPPAVKEYYEKKASAVFEPLSATLRRIVLSDYERERILGGKRDTTHS